MEWDKHLEEFKKKLKKLQKQYAYQKELNQICLSYVSEFFNQLEQDFKSRPDLEEAEEICFFKHIKPVALGYHLYYRYLIQLEHEKPVNTLKTQKRYYKELLDTQHQFKLRHIGFAYYLKSKQTHLDHIYFLRQQPLPFDPDDLSTHLNRYYNTSRDYLTAKLRSNDLISDYLSARLDKVTHTSTSYSDSPHLDWSGSRTDLIELIYALYHSKVIHKGKADIIEIARALGSFFKIDPGDVYKTFAEIKSRKKSRTKFLDELATNLQLAMDREDF
ncbi:RteC domain-containing protein [Leeuwenhoekiella sp. NPDC079379]|uniref:RteC domain-containing protein n=1 Tax=Leeuwenhoekiella sp. NPDC079379 TaxID=3364122 RepID=UPI0037CC7581